MKISLLSIISLIIFSSTKSIKIPKENENSLLNIDLESMINEQNFKPELKQKAEESMEELLEECESNLKLKVDKVMKKPEKKFKRTIKKVKFTKVKENELKGSINKLREEAELELKSRAEILFNHLF